MFKDFKTAVREELHIQGDGYKEHHIPQTFIEYLSCVSHVLNTEYSKEHRVYIANGQNVHNSIVFNSENGKQ